MKKILLILTMVLFAMQAWGATYYITQSGTGDGSAPTTPDSIADFNAATAPFDDLAGDTVYFIGTFTTILNTAVAGSSGNVCELRGDLEGYSRATWLNTTGVRQIIIDQDYISLIGHIAYITNDNGEGACVGISGANNLVLSDLILTGSATGTGDMVIGINITGNCDTITISDCDISSLEIGIKFKAEANTIANVTVEDNIIYNMNQGDLTNADGIKFDGNAVAKDYSGIIIQDNNIYNCADQCIDLWAGKNVTIRRNLLHDNISGGDMTGIKTGSTDNDPVHSGIIIVNNILYNFSKRGISAFSMDGTIAGNTIFNCGEEAISVENYGTAASLTIQNNIMYNAGIGGADPIFRVQNGAQARLSALDNNLYFLTGENLIVYNGTAYSDSQFTNYQSAVDPFDAMSITTNPRITSTGKLYNNSPCKASKNPGTAVAGVNGTGTTDLWGNAGRDGYIPIGAYFGSGIFQWPVKIGKDKGRVFRIGR